MKKKKFLSLFVAAAAIMSISIPVFATGISDQNMQVADDQTAQSQNEESDGIDVNYGKLENMIEKPHDRYTTRGTFCSDSVTLNGEAQSELPDDVLKFCFIDGDILIGEFFGEEFQVPAWEEDEDTITLIMSESESFSIQKTEKDKLSLKLAYGDKEYDITMHKTNVNKVNEKDGL